MPARDLTPPGVASTKAANTNAGETSVKLYGYFRSSAAYRVRIALNLKNLSAEQQSVHLTRNGGWQWSEEYRAIEPAEARAGTRARSTGEVAAAVARDRRISRRGAPAAAAAARPIRSSARRCAPFAQIIACDIHPVNNLAALNYLKGPLKHDQAAVDDWYRHWVTEGFDAIEALLRPGPYAFGAHRDDGRPLPRAAGVQRTPLQGRHGASIRRSPRSMPPA